LTFLAISRSLGKTPVGSIAHADRCAYAREAPVNRDKPTASAASYGARGWSLPLTLVTGIGLPLGGTLLLTSLFTDWQGISLPLHSTLEVGGATLGMVLAIIVLSSQQPALTSRRMWIACALVSMAGFDILHGSVPIGVAFIWLHGMAVLSGGILFALVWWPERPITRATGWTVMGAVLLLTVLVGVLSVVFSQHLPVMMENGEFTAAADVQNFLGGGLTLLAAVSFAVRYHREGSREELHWLLLCLFFGMAGVLFHFSSIWEAAWWFWHVVRLGGYLLAFGLAIRFYWRSESRFGQLIENCPIPMCFVNAEGRFVYSNKRFTESFGYTFKDVSTLDEWWEAAYPDEGYRKWVLDTWNEAVKRAAKDGSTIEPIEYRVTCKDHTEKILAISGATIGDSFLATFVDVTERNRAEREIVDLNLNLEKRVSARTRELKLTNHELESFCYSLSHDLVTPLRAIDGWALSLAEDYAPQLDESGQEKVARLRQAAQHMGTQIDDLLQLSRVNRQALQRQPVSMDQTVQAALARLEQEADSRPLPVSVQPLPACSGSPVSLTQVWINLIGNALKFSAGREAPQVVVGANTSAEGETVYFVKDNGAGFDMRYADKLFKAFQRLHRPKDFKGVGMGLALSQRIIQRHHGRIWAEGVVNEGATFFFTVPDEDDAESPPRSISGQQHQASPAG